jgi:ketosteroid isomerase-like protein
MITPARKVFISYRREETAGHAGRLHDAIAPRFGDANVFMDVDLAPGVDFVERVTEAVGACDVLLVVIGPNWARTTDGRGNVRLADSNDFVRLEVEIALRRPDVAVIPLLVGGAQMPAPDQLPESIRGLSRRNALELSDLRWRYDVGRLIDTLGTLLGEGPPDAPDSSARPAAPSQPGHPDRTARRRRALIGGVLAAAALGIGATLLGVAGVFSSDEPAGTHTTAGATGSSDGVTTDDAARLMERYKQAYEAKDIAGLRGLVAPDVVLREGRKLALRGASRVMARYRAEFDQFGMQSPTFDFEEANADSTEDAAWVAGPYVISIDGTGRETGRFAIRVRSIGSQLFISEICSDCPDVRPDGPLPAG